MKARRRGKKLEKEWALSNQVEKPTIETTIHFHCRNLCLCLANCLEAFESSLRFGFKVFLWHKHFANSASKEGNLTLPKVLKARTLPAQNAVLGINQRK